MAVVIMPVIFSKLKWSKTKLSPFMNALKSKFFKNVINRIGNAIAANIKEYRNKLN